jgi:hypothetical protein
MRAVAVRSCNGQRHATPISNMRYPLSNDGCPWQAVFGSLQIYEQLLFVSLTCPVDHRCRYYSYTVTEQLTTESMNYYVIKILRTIL